MPKFKYTFGGEAADWQENLYHRTFDVKDGIIDFEDDDELAVDALLRRGWERVAATDDSSEDAPKAKAARTRVTPT